MEHITAERVIKSKNVHKHASTLFVVAPRIAFSMCRLALSLEDTLPRLSIV